MERKGKRSHSRKALGQLYDRVAVENFDYVPSCEDEFDSRITEGFAFTDSILADARSMKAQYDMAVRRLLKQFRVATEFELYSGWAMSKPAVGSDYKRQEDLGQQFDTLKHRFREMCIEAAGEAAGRDLDELVAAIYKVTKEEVQSFLAEAEADGENLEFSPRAMPLIGFPWIFHWILVKIAMADQFKPHKTFLAPAIRFAPMSAAAPPREASGEVSQNAAAPKMGEQRKSIETPREAPKVNGEVDLIDFEADAVETGPEMSCDTPDETTENNQSLQSAKSFETTPSKPGTGAHSPRSTEPKEEFPAAANVAGSAEPILQRLEYRESAMDKLLRLCDDSDEE